MSIVRFPRAFKHPLPADAIPRGRDRHVTVCPFRGRWAFYELDEGGGSFVADLTKSQAMQMAMTFVMQYRAELTVLNYNPDDATEACK